MGKVRNSFKNTDRIEKLGNGGGGGGESLVVFVEKGTKTAEELFNEVDELWKAGKLVVNKNKLLTALDADLKILTQRSYQEGMFGEPDITYRFSGYTGRVGYVKNDAGDYSMNAIY